MAQSSKTRPDLYLKISLKLNKREVNDLRNYVESRDLLPARDLEKMDPMKMFIELEKKRKLGAGKLQLLDELMTSIGRLDLAEEVKQAAEEERNGSDTVGRNEDASESHRTERDAGDDSGENCDSSLDESLQTAGALVATFFLGVAATKTIGAIVSGREERRANESAEADNGCSRKRKLSSGSDGAGGKKQR